jgi:hypothetical protein
MSLDFYVWRGPRLTAEEFGQRLIDLDEHNLDEASLFEWSDRLPRFRRDVLSRYPALEDLPEHEVDSGTPWAMTPVDSTRFIELSFRWSVTKEQLTFILGRALYHGLHIYDPQDDEVIAPGPERWQVWLRKLGLGRLAGPDRPW